MTFKKLTRRARNWGWIFNLGNFMPWSVMAIFVLQCSALGCCTPRSLHVQIIASIHHQAFKLISLQQPYRAQAQLIPGKHSAASTRWRNIEIITQQERKCVMDTKWWNWAAPFSTSDAIHHPLLRSGAQSRGQVIPFICTSHLGNLGSGRCYDTWLELETMVPEVFIVPRDGLLLFESAN